MSNKLVDLEVDQIDLDKSNPRIQLALDTYGEDKITSFQIALALKEGEGDSTTTLYKLKESIRTCGHIINPIVVNKINGKYICVEGNTRVQIYRDFKNEGVEGQWEHIPCLLFDNATSEQMDSIRLQAHLVGPRAWTLYAKARYIHKLWNVDYLTKDQIIQYCGGNNNEIEKQLSAYKLFEEVYKKKFPNPDVKNFSGFVEFQPRKIKFAVSTNGFTEEDFCKWIHQRRFSRLEDVRELPKILSNEDAREKFLKSNSREALKLLNWPELVEIVEKFSLDNILEMVIQKIILLDGTEKKDYQANSTVILSRLNRAEEQIKKLKEALAK